LEEEALSLSLYLEKEHKKKKEEGRRKEEAEEEQNEANRRQEDNEIVAPFRRSQISKEEPLVRVPRKRPRPGARFTPARSAGPRDIAHVM
jgi:hypothetical protein